MIVDILRVYRNLQNRIYGYDILIHDKNETTYIEANKLKELVKSKKININGYKLTKNNRLIPLNKHYSNPNNIYYLMNKDSIVGSFDIDTRNLNIW